VESVDIIDSFPVTVCDNYRMPRAKIYHQEVYRGYISSKKRYFYGLKIHLMVTSQGQPVECFLTPGSSSDVHALRSFQFDVPEGSFIYADKAYNDYGMQDLMHESAHIELSPIRQKEFQTCDTSFYCICATLLSQKDRNGRQLDRKNITQSDSCGHRPRL
jgi:hypothetical protein